MLVRANGMGRGGGGLHERGGAATRRRRVDGGRVVEVSVDSGEVGVLHASGGGGGGSVRGKEGSVEGVSNGGDGGSHGWKTTPNQRAINKRAINTWLPNYPTSIDHPHGTQISDLPFGVNTILPPAAEIEKPTWPGWRSRAAVGCHRCRPTRNRVVAAHGAHTPASRTSPSAQRQLLTCSIFRYSVLHRWLQRSPRHHTLAHSRTRATLARCEIVAHRARQLDFRPSLFALFFEDGRASGD